MIEGQKPTVESVFEPALIELVGINETRAIIAQAIREAVGKTLPGMPRSPEAVLQVEAILKPVVEHLAASRRSGDRFSHLRMDHKALPPGPLSHFAKAVRDAVEAAGVKFESITRDDFNCDPAARINILVAAFTAVQEFVHMVGERRLNELAQRVRLPFLLSHGKRERFFSYEELVDLTPEQLAARWQEFHRSGFSGSATHRWGHDLALLLADSRFIDAIIEQKPPEIQNLPTVRVWIDRLAAATSREVSPLPVVDQKEYLLSHLPRLKIELGPTLRLAQVCAQCRTRSPGVVDMKKYASPMLASDAPQEHWRRVLFKFFPPQRDVHRQRITHMQHAVRLATGLSNLDNAYRQAVDADIATSRNLLLPTESDRAFLNEVTWALTARLNSRDKPEPLKGSLGGPFVAYVSPRAVERDEGSHWDMGVSIYDRSVHRASEIVGQKDVPIHLAEAFFAELLESGAVQKLTQLLQRASTQAEESKAAYSKLHFTKMTTEQLHILAVILRYVDGIFARLMPEVITELGQDPAALGKLLQLNKDRFFGENITQ